jgi:quercetin dioxygenase-like cupin family protein
MSFIGSISTALALVAGLLVSPFSQSAQAAEQVTVKSLMTKALAEHPGKEVLIITVDYAPGAADPVHRHDAHGFIYVLEGEIVMGVKGGKEQLLKAGQTFYEGPHDLHTVGRNASKTKPAKFLVFLVKETGKDFFIPVQDKK